MRYAEAKDSPGPQWTQQGDQISGTPHPYPVPHWLIASASEQEYRPKG